MPSRPPMFRPNHMPKADAFRKTASERGYDGQWRKLRDQHIAQHPLCVICEARGRTRAATVVDHKLPIAVDPSRRLDPTNLRSVCTDCHAELTTNFKTTGRNEPNPTRKLFTGWMV